ncbi:Gfo/Idh/MocA family protein [Maribacter chungangensis]|uniref:Gfo/Idh/MocA family protein n=1 Tax=Maribacter chungangensis TaxID=1069117 RepID=A0ABW3B0A4_9FLAO
MNKIKGVCIGLGYFSRFHLEAWLRMEKVEITALCDSNMELAQQTAEDLGIASAYSDFNEMLQQEKPDFIDIITPPNSHKRLCVAAAEKGIHIICQKPLAPSLAESEEIATAISKYGVRMMVHENFRFQPWHREIKKLLEQHTIGNQFHGIHWRMRMGDGWQEDAYMNRQPYFREMKQLLMYETGIHLIDVLRFFGGDINQVFAKLQRFNPNIKGEDSALVICDFTNGGTAILDANRYNESRSQNPRLTFGEVRIECDKGSIHLHEDGRISIKKLGRPEVEHEYTFEDNNFAGDCVYYTQQHFIRQLDSGEPFETDVQDYLDNIKVLEKVYASHEKRIPIKIL